MKTWKLRTNVQNAAIAGDAMNAPTVISLFAGCGGSSLGYHMAGYNELLAIDFDDNAIQTFKLNFKDVPMLKADISQVSGAKIMKLCKLQAGELDLLDGSPPCQGFSTAGKRQVCDDRNDLVNHYIRLIHEIQPKVFVMENVSGMIKGKMKGLFIEYIKAMKDAGYQVSCRLLNAKWFSVPQSRQRMICIGVRNDLKMQPVFPKAHDRLITVGEALKDVVNKTHAPFNKDYEIVFSQIPQGSTAIKSCSKTTLQKYIPRMIKNKTFNFQGMCKRLNPKKPSPAIIKNFIPYAEAPIHPTENRYLSIEEVKRLQSFPDDFKFIGKFEQQWARIGNSVPPLMTKAIAETIRIEILAKIQQP